MDIFKRKTTTVFPNSKEKFIYIELIFIHESYPWIIVKSFRLFYLEFLPQTMTVTPRTALKGWMKWTQLILIIIIKIITDEISWPWFMLITCKKIIIIIKIYGLFFSSKLGTYSQKLLVNLILIFPHNPNTDGYID